MTERETKAESGQEVDETSEPDGNAVEVSIKAIGAHGDGLADGPDDMALFVPFALPGETWRHHPETGEATLVLRHPDRLEPACPHFTQCGGCVAQHMPPEIYADWKRSLVVTALERARVSVEVAALITNPPASRRRATLAARRRMRGIHLGFHARATHEVVDIAHCAILSPAIGERLEHLRALALELNEGKEQLRLAVVATETGLSVDIEGAKTSPSAEARAKLAEIARAGGIVRLVVNGSDIVEFATPEINVDDVPIRLPDRVFLQATEEAEVAMIDRVVKACAGAKRVADLFSGVGTFALALSRTAQVAAFDSEASAIAALAVAHGRSVRRKPVAATVRDLFREPLSRKELSSFDAVVFDPPRAGARAQAESLARSDVPVVVGVSCNPATFARDAKCLVDGGYSIETVTPIDQFVFSEHVEVIAVFRKPPRRKRLGQRR